MIREAVNVVPSIELQKAVYNALKNHYEVFEIIPPNHPTPFITLGDESFTVDYTKNTDCTIHYITVHTWSSGTSSLEIKTMNDTVISTIRGGLEADGFNISMITLELLTTLKEIGADTTIFHGVVQFEMYLEKI